MLIKKLEDSNVDVIVSDGYFEKTDSTGTNDLKPHIDVTSRLYAIGENVIKEKGLDPRDYDGVFIEDGVLFIQCHDNIKLEEKYYAE